MQSKYRRLVVQGANTLSATWSNHLPLNSTTLPKLLHIEWNILKDTQTFPDHITLATLHTVNPYLPESNARQALKMLVQKGLLNIDENQSYYFSERTRCFIRDVEHALQSAAQSVQTLNVEQSHCLANITTKLVDQLGTEINSIQKPIFNLALNAITPSEHPLPQLQQRLFALQAYYEDIFNATCHRAYK